jgi:proline iminopeptidase
MSQYSAQLERTPGELRALRSFDGARLEYEVAGTGPPLVMLHGLLAGRQTFSRQRGALAGQRWLLMLSARGHDGSDALLPSGSGVGNSDVDDLCALLAAEQVERCDLIGHSSGAATALAFTLRYPQRVGRLVLVEPALLGLLSPADRSPIVADLMAVAATAEAEGPQAALRAALDLTGGAPWHRLDAETRAKRLQAIASVAPMVGAHMRGLCELSILAADVLGLPVPALLLYGENTFPFHAAIAARFRELRSDLQVLTLASAGHNVHRDQAEVVNAEIAAFLADSGSVREA